jgi:hypothetical protein
MKTELASPSVPKAASAGRFMRNILAKAIFLFFLFNLGFACLNPIPCVGRISLYNHLFPGRLRLPFGEDFETSYNISILQLDAMFASHEINAGPKPEDEMRVLLLGDSSVWGFLLGPDQTLSAELNDYRYKTSGGKDLRFFNLGYPTMSVMKDLLLLDFAMRYKPDLIVWFVTLESLPVKKQLSSPLVQYNPEAVRDLIHSYQLEIDIDDERFVDHALWQQTIVGQRRELADLIRLQLLGVMWAATHIDHNVPATYEPLQVELKADAAFQEFQPGEMPARELAMDVLQAGVLLAGKIPVIIVNEPIFLAQGQNSEIRYNPYYPRWAYDEFRELLQNKASSEGWHYLDLWNVVPAEAFTDNAIHYSPPGVDLVAERVMEYVAGLIDQSP